MEAKSTEAIQRVRDALLEGSPVPEGAQAALTDAERAEIASLAAVAMLTKTALHAAEPPPHAEGASLHRAQGILATRRPASARRPMRTRAGIAGWFARFLGKR